MRLGAMPSLNPIDVGAFTLQSMVKVCQDKAAIVLVILITYVAIKIIQYLIDRAIDMVTKKFEQKIATLESALARSNINNSSALDTLKQKIAHLELALARGNKRCIAMVSHINGMKAIQVILENASNPNGDVELEPLLFTKEEMTGPSGKKLSLDEWRAFMKVQLEGVADADEYLKYLVRE